MSRRFPPVIILGAPRSGTSMLARLLERLGLFIGKERNEMEEARFFHRINNWIISQSGGRWDFPAPTRLVLDHEQVRRSTVDYIRFLLGSPRVVRYLGWRQYLRYHSVFHLDLPWGWKSPFSTFTLPIWLEVFPGARVIHIVRHGVDAAQSLRVRGPLVMERNTWGRKIYYSFKALHWIRPKQGNFLESIRCASLEGGFSLWEEYVSEARKSVRELGERALEIKYEDLLLNPRPELRAAARFCELSATDEDIARVARQARKERAYGYRNHPELAAFAERMAERLKLHGY